MQRFDRHAYVRCTYHDIFTSFAASTIAAQFKVAYAGCIEVLERSRNIVLNAPKVSGLDFNLRVALALMAVAVIFVSVYPALSDWVKLKSLPVPRQCISLCLNGRYCEAQALTLQALQKREYITYSLDDDLDLARSCLILGNYEEARKIAVSVSQSLTEPAVSDVDKFRIDRGRSLQVEALICLQQYDKALVILNSIKIWNMIGISALKERRLLWDQGRTPVLSPLFSICIQGCEIVICP